MLPVNSAEFSGELSNAITMSSSVSEAANDVWVCFAVVFFHDGGFHNNESHTMTHILGYADIIFSYSFRWSAR